MAVVTISREYGTGGVELARNLARRLGCPFIGREEMAAELNKRGIQIDLERIEGRPPGLIERLLGTNRTELRENLRTIMTEAADAGGVVVGGWGGQILLRDRKDALHIRIVGTKEARIRRLMDSAGVTRSLAEETIEHADRNQSLFSGYFFQADFADAKLYHAVLNMEQIPEEGLIDLILGMIPEVGAGAAP